MPATGKSSSLLLSLLCLVFCSKAGADKVDFARDVQPIFKTACYQCHGPDKQKGKLRLDAKTIALHGGKSGKAVVPRQVEQSEVFKRITSKDDDERMPQDREPLKAEEIAVIKGWIEQGAAWPDEASAADAKIEKHWALVAPKRVEVPSVGKSDWVRNDVDRFIFARLEKEKIAPSPQATRIQLLRRVSLDLIGLPPTPRELED